jgi:hypothetical protein
MKRRAKVQNVVSERVKSRSKRERVRVKNPDNIYIPSHIKMI